MSDETDVQITEEVRQATLDALVLYYRGGILLADAFTRTDGTGYGSYYRLKESHPVDVREIDREARQTAVEERLGTQLVFDSEQLELSHMLQKQAAEALLKALPKIAKLAEGGVLTVKVRKGAAGEVDKSVVIYPRDQLQAAGILQAVAKSGVVPDELMVPPHQDSAAEEETQVLALPLPVNADFRRIVATKADGTRVIATVDKPGEVIVIEPDTV